MLRQRKGYVKILLHLTIGDEEDNVIFLAPVERIEQ
jgi:hypothetical protein